MRETIRKTSQAAVLAGIAAIAIVGCASAPPAPPPVVEPKEAPQPPAPPVVNSLPPPAAPGIRAGSLQDFEVNVGNRVFFGYDRFELSAEAQAVLRRQAAWLNTYPNVKILVAGNCDERGTREYNLALGAKRAAAAKEFLVGLGVAPNRIETVSYGKERPVDARPNEDGWAVNRNAHTQIQGGAVS